LVRLHPTESDNTEIAGAIESSEFFSFDTTDDNSGDGAVYAANKATASDSAIYAADNDTGLPVAWGRGKFELLQKDINISIINNEASVSVTHYVGGTLFVDTTDDGIRNPWEKPFEDKLTRNAMFTRGLNGWRLTKISPLDISLKDAGQQTVQVEWVRASVDGEVVWETASSETLFGVPDELPNFLPQTVVLVEAKITNSSTSGYEPQSYVFFHHRGGLHVRARDIMFDDGSNGDETASDNIFSITYTIGHHPGRHFAVVDVIDSATFIDEDAAYNSTAWGIPYIVAPPPDVL